MQRYICAYICSCSCCATYVGVKKCLLCANEFLNFRTTYTSKFAFLVSNIKKLITVFFLCLFVFWKIIMFLLPLLFAKRDAFCFDVSYTSLIIGACFLQVLEYLPTIVSLPVFCCFAKTYNIIATHNGIAHDTSDSQTVSANNNACHCCRHLSCGCHCSVPAIIIFCCQCLLSD